MTDETLEDIARRLGISRRTLSRVIQGGRLVAPALRQKIERHLAATDYVPNALAAHFAAQRVPVIGLVFPSTFLNSIDDYVARVIKGALRAAHAGDHQVTLLSFDGLDREKSLRLFKSRLVGGFVFVAFGSPDGKALRALRAEGVPLAALNFQADGVDSFDCDNERGGHLATRHLIETGRRRIAFLHGAEVWSSSRERREGFARAMKEAQLPSPWIAEGHYEPVAAEKAVNHWMALDPGPDAIFAANDIMMLAAYKSLRRHNRRVPQDVSLMGFDDSPICSMPHLEVTFSSIHQPLEAIAQAATERVMALMSASSFPTAVHRLFPPELKIRESTGRPRVSD